jgi:hypothetical protein
LQSEYQSGTGRGFSANRPQIVGDIERSILQESSKTMNLKGLWNTGGYCLSSNAGAQLEEERKLFLFPGWKSKTRKNFSSSLAIKRLNKDRVLSRGEMD